MNTYSPKAIYDEILFPQENGEFKLPELAYKKNGLEPFLSQETINYHWGKHHQGYIDKLNAELSKKKLQPKSLVDLLKTSTGDKKLFNLAAQAWNHAFYWKCLTPQSNEEISDDLRESLEKNFGDVESFKAQFNGVAKSHFGSGWIWLVKDQGGGLHIEATSNAETPLSQGKHVLLVCDVWEHAYYIDYRNDKGAYLDNYWDKVNWKFVNLLYQ